MPKQICVAAPPPKSELEHRQAVNKGAAQFVPTVLIAIVGYATWVVVVTLGAHYLLHPAPNTLRTRTGAGIAVILLYFVFLLPTAITYFRLLGTVKDPGFTPQGTPSASTPIQQREPQVERNVVRCCTNTKVTERPPSSSASAKSTPSSSSAEKPGIGPHGQDVTTLDLEAIFCGDVPPPPGLDKFYEKDIFACDQNGLPIWCGTCCNWKPDRTRHCSDVGRCVRKLDHFCPWVGGVVAEKNFKFFIQFNCYTALFTCYILIVMAYFVAEAKSDPTLSLNVHWCVVLGLGALFTLFTASMAGTSLRLVLLNQTTIDNIDHTKRTMYLAVLIPPRIHPKPLTPPPPARFNITNSTPRPRTSSTTHSRRSRTSEKQASPWQGTITYPIYTRPSSSFPNTQVYPPTPTVSHPRTFAILHTAPGTNPWNTGPYNNFKSVMGNSWYDWFLPVRLSPCSKHDRGDTFYEFGADVAVLKRDAGLSSSSSAGFDDDDDAGEGVQKRTRRKRRRRGAHTASQESMGSTLGTCDGETGRVGSGRHRDRDGDDGSL